MTVLADLLDLEAASQEAEAAANAMADALEAQAAALRKAARQFECIALISWEAARALQYGEPE